MNSFRYVVVAFLLAALAPASLRPQAKGGMPMPPPDFGTKYDRSQQGLLVQFQMILTNARDPDKTKALIQELGLPKYEEYFHTVYQPDVELFWSGSYTRALTHAQSDFQSLFVRLGMQEGEFNIRKINDAPASKLEQALIAKMNGPVEIYAVSWKKRKATDNSGAELLGYYAYLSGRFRWFYMLGFPKTAAEAAKTPAKPAAKPSAGVSKAPAGGKSGSSPTSSQPPAQQ